MCLLQFSGEISQEWTLKESICANVLEGLNCFRFGWLYHDFERSLFAFLQEPNVSPKLFQLLARLKESMDKQEENQIYEARVEIAHTLRSLVSIVTIAAAGLTPQRPKRTHLFVAIILIVFFLSYFPMVHPASVIPFLFRK